MNPDGSLWLRLPLDAALVATIEKYAKRDDKTVGDIILWSLERIAGDAQAVKEAVARVAARKGGAQ